MHGLIPIYYSSENLGLDKDSKNAYRRQEYFDAASKLCEKWEQVSFKSDYSTEELFHFERLVREFSKRPFFSSTILQERN